MPSLATFLSSPALIQAAPALAGAAIGVTGTLLVTITNGLLTRDKFMRERLWEKRQDACNTIVSQLRAAQPYGSRMEDGFAENAYGYYQSEALVAANKAYDDRISAAHDAFQANYLILPSAFRRRYERMVKDRGAWWFDSGPEVYLGPVGVNGVAARDLMDIARASLGIAPFFSRQIIRWRPIARALPSWSSQLTRRIKRRWRRWRKPPDNDLDF